MLTGVEMVDQNEAANADIGEFYPAHPDVPDADIYKLIPEDSYNSGVRTCPSTVHFSNKEIPKEIPSGIPLLYIDVYKK